MAVLSIVTPKGSPRVSTGHIILWQNIFVVVDDGKVPASQYASLNRRIVAQAAAYKDGVGAVVIIPENATPPPEDVRNAINDALKGLAGSLRSLCWVVEGTGFQGAMVRCVLNGIRMFSRNPYPTSITANLDDALAWTLPHLGKAPARASDLSQARQQIRLERGGAAAQAV
jgi:hypothetical protein